LQTPPTNPNPSIQAVQTLGWEQAEQESTVHFTHSDVKVFGSLKKVIAISPGNATHRELIWLGLNVLMSVQIGFPAEDFARW
jgi:hypothetical protein